MLFVEGAIGFPDGVDEMEELAHAVAKGDVAAFAFGSESLFQKPYAVVRLRGRLYRNRSRYFAPVSRRSIN